VSTTKHKRSDRVAERIRAELMELVTRGGLRDPGLESCYVTDVRVTDDLQHARVYVRVLGEEIGPEEQARVLSALGRASGYIRRELAPRLKLKYHPELRFFWDDGVDRARRVEDLLASIAEEEDARGARGEGQA
jgi:ribosome-binding factor A